MSYPNQLEAIISNKSVKLLVLLSCLFIANTLVAEFIGVKIFSLESIFGFEPTSWKLFGYQGSGLNLTAGVVLWPVVFIMTDIINEYFGPKVVRHLSYIAIGIVLFSFIIIFVAIKLPPNEWWQYESGRLDNTTQGLSDMNLAFNKVMGQGLWIIIGSMVAFLVGQILDVTVFHIIKKKTGEKYVWLRATGSTLVSQFVDSYIVLLVAFWIGSNWSIENVIAIGTVNYIYKFIVAILLTPMIYLGHFIIDKYLGIELAHKLKFQAQSIT